MRGWEGDGTMSLVSSVACARHARGDERGVRWEGEAEVVEAVAVEGREVVVVLHGEVDESVPRPGEAERAVGDVAVELHPLATPIKRGSRDGERVVLKACARVFVRVKG